MYDIIIIGMGISGISAALYAKEANMKVLMFEGRMPGGLLNSIDKVKNYAGLNEVNGYDFAMKLLDQINSSKIPYKMEEVIKIENLEDKKIVHTTNGLYECKKIILATGRRPRFLGLDNEKKLLGRGISTCAICDGGLYKNKTIAVVGSGNSALQEALYLADIVEKLYLIIRKDKISGAEGLAEAVIAKENIEILYESKITKINEDNNIVKSIIINDKEELLVSGIFIYIGYIPDSELVKDFNITNKAGYIEVNDKYESNVKGIYAIGDIIVKDLYQLVTGASDGAKVIIKMKIEE